MYKKVLIVVGNRAADRAAVREGVALAAVHGSSVLFFHVLPRYTVVVADMPSMIQVGDEQFAREARSNGERLLAAARVVADRADVRSKGVLGRGADDAKCIAEAAKKERCGLVVVGTEGRNALLRLMTGSVVAGLVTSCPVPLLVCRAAARKRAAARGAAPAAPRRQRAAMASPPMARQRPVA